MRLLARLSLIAGLAGLVLPGQASAGIHTLVFNSAPTTVTRYEVARGVRPGTYRLFCSLHPALMTQLVVVH